MEKESQSPLEPNLVHRWTTSPQNILEATPRARGVFHQPPILGAVRTPEACWLYYQVQLQSTSSQTWQTRSWQMTHQETAHLLLCLATLCPAPPKTDYIG